MVAGAALVFALPAAAFAQAPTSAGATVEASEAEHRSPRRRRRSTRGPAAAEPADASAALNALAAALPALDDDARARARALLVRPTDGSADRYGDGFPKAAPVDSAESEHFCVFFVSSPEFADAPDLTDANGLEDGDGTPDYVEAVLTMAERLARGRGRPGALGWAPPKPDLAVAGPTLGSRRHLPEAARQRRGVRLRAADPGPGQIRSKYGYLVIDDDYAPAEYGFADPLAAARATVAHEFNHLLQQNYDSFQDVWIFEATAVWAEEQVFPEVNDYLNYVEVVRRAPRESRSPTAMGRGA